MTMTRCAYRLLLCGALLVLLAPAAFASSDAGVNATIDAATAPFDNLQVNEAIALPDGAVPARGDFPGEEFWVRPRKEKIERFRCSRCHTGKETLIKVRNGVELTHGEIRFDHGQQSLVCTVCHFEKERDFLVNTEGEKIDFDHSYRLCGQCHFRQLEDWAGGAHGKRDTYWAGQRVVWNCADCHDPHAPRFDKRWPETYSAPLDEQGR